MSYDTVILKLKSFECRAFPLPFGVAMPQDLGTFDEDELEVFIAGLGARYVKNTNRSSCRRYDFHYAGPYYHTLYIFEHGVSLSGAGQFNTLVLAEKMSPRFANLIIVDPQEGLIFDIASLREKLARDPSQNEEAIRRDMEKRLVEFIDSPKPNEHNRQSAREALADLRAQDEEKERGDDRSREGSRN
jgi:hypothetical protein